MDPLTGPVERLAWELRRLRDQAGRPSYRERMEFSPDGRTMVTIGDRNAIFLWNVATAKVLRVNRDGTAPISTMAFSPDGKMLAVGGNDKTLRLLDPERLTELARLQSHVDVTQLMLSPNLQPGLGDGVSAASCCAT